MKREIGLGYCRHQPPPVVSQGFTKTSAPEKPKVPGFQSWSPEETQFQKKWCQPDLVPLSSTLGIWWPPSATPWGLVELCQKPACPNTARWSRTKLVLARTTFVVGSEKASYSLCSTADLFPELTWSQQANSETSWCEPAMLHSPTSEEKNLHEIPWTETRENAAWDPALIAASDTSQTCLSLRQS